MSTRSQAAVAITRRSRARQKFLSIQTPNPNGDSSNRDEWLEQTCNGFVSPSLANKAYYRAVLEELWPKGHGIPGPQVRQDRLRTAIDKFRAERKMSGKPYKNYVDAFRRVRELQGEEGV